MDVEDVVIVATIPTLFCLFFLTLLPASHNVNRFVASCTVVILPSFYGNESHCCDRCFR